MVVLTVFEVSEIFDKTKVIFDDKKEEKGTTKKGDSFLKREFLYKEGERMSPIIVRFSKAESWGMKEFKNERGVKSYSFNIVMDLLAEDAINELINTLEMIAKKGLPKDLKKTTSFHKFSPVRNGNLYYRVPYNHWNQEFFCRFQNRKEIGRPKDFLRKNVLWMRQLDSSRCLFPTERPSCKWSCFKSES